MRVLGLMSGTSMDGIDVAAIDVRRNGGGVIFSLERFESNPYPQAVRASLERAGSSDSNAIAELGSLNFALGEAFAAEAKNMCGKIAGVELIGSHGQTLFHDPSPSASSHRSASTLQFGEPAVIASRTGVTTVADFRVADVAAGGQGAPLVSYVDWLTLRSARESRVVVNIGGIANVTVLPAGCSQSEVRAFDTGPGNMLIDLAVRSLYSPESQFDRNGQIAARGAVHGDLLEWLLSHPYFSRPAPKSAGREEFGPIFFSKVCSKAENLGCRDDDLVATLTELTAHTIAASLPRECNVLVVAGGGAHNQSLMRALDRAVSSVGINAPIVTSDAYGFPVDAKEAIAFALLAFATLHGQINTVPSATGAHAGVVAGKIVPGANFNALMRSVWSTAG